MDTRERLQLEKLISANDVEDVTNDIMKRKHSVLIKADIEEMTSLKHKYSALALSSPEEFEALLISNCNFLFTNYFDIFNRIKKNELNLTIMDAFLMVLKQIEDGELDQHTGAYKVGKLLKELYIDSAITRGDRLDAKHAESNNDESNNAEHKIKSVNINWKQYKEMSINSDGN